MSAWELGQACFSPPAALVQPAEVSVSVKGRDIIVIGASAGGLDALEQLVAGLPADIPASLFIVHHLSPLMTGEVLIARMGKHDHFEPKLATDRERFRPGRIYVAPPDRHLLIKEDHMLVTRGARENRYRPAVDPLFRSAAVAHGPRVIGVVLTGMLDDGTAGLVAIQKCGGVTVVQDPAEAEYPAMPQSALDNLQVDHCVELRAMGELLDRLSREPAGKKKPVPADVQAEAEIAERVLSEAAELESLGEPVPYTCPDCGGVLWQMEPVGDGRFRCHTGHTFNAPTLLAGQTAQIEETLWTSLRMFEERKNLLRHMSKTPGAGVSASAERIREAQVHIDRIRAILHAPALTEPTSTRSGPDARREADRAKLEGRGAE